MIKRYFDLHCDTIGEIYTRVRKNESNPLHFDFEKVSKCYDEISQVFAVYSPHEMTDDQAYDNFFETLHHAKQLKIPKNITAYLSVEGGKLLGGKIERFDTLKANNVCILTLVWRDNCCIGGGHNSKNGLTPFGFSVLKKCLDNGIIVDISHSSDKMFFEVANHCEKSDKPFIASHSNSRTVCNHTRNLTNEMFLKVKAVKGIVGISFAPQHLNPSKTATVADVARHIEHYFSLGGEDIVCIGSDFDGIDVTPIGLESPDKLYNLADFLTSKGYTGNQINKIFYDNAAAFFSLNKIKKHTFFSK